MARTTATFLSDIAFDYPGTAIPNRDYQPSSLLLRARTTVLIPSVRPLHSRGVPEVDAIEQMRSLATGR